MDRRRKISETIDFDWLECGGGGGGGGPYSFRHVFLITL